MIYALFADFGHIRAYIARLITAMIRGAINCYQALFGEIDDKQLID
jgi:hypothetical protein